MSDVDHSQSFRRVDERGRPLFEYDFVFGTAVRHSTVTGYPDRDSLQAALLEEAKSLPRVDELLRVKLDCGCERPYGVDGLPALDDEDACEHGTPFVKYGWQTKANAALDRLAEENERLGLEY